MKLHAGDHWQFMVVLLYPTIAVPTAPSDNKKKFELGSSMVTFGNSRIAVMRTMLSDGIQGWLNCPTPQYSRLAIAIYHDDELNKIGWGPVFLALQDAILVMGVKCE